MKRLVSCLCACLFSAVLFGQGAHHHNSLSRSEIGILGGGTYYIGDLNQKHFNHTNLAFELMYRYNVHSRFALRANFIYGKVEAYDSESKHDIIVNRNLSFQTPLYELSGGVEFTYLPFEIGHRKYKSTAYVMVDLAATRINPTTDYNGNKVELQPIGTEGQGTSASSRGVYSKTQLAVPFGFGFRFTLTENIGLNLEYGMRFLFTDYLDDVSSSRYADPAIILSENGPIAAELSNRSIDQNRFGRRGDPASRDWYAFTGIGLSIRLGGKNPCPAPR